jgi:hypothetical protein
MNLEKAVNHGDTADTAKNQELNGENPDFLICRKTYPLGEDQTDIIFSLCIPRC